MVVLYAIALLILIRFIFLNYINWQYGDLGTGKAGVQYWLDTNRYLSGADKIINNINITGRDVQYMGYMLFIAILELIGLHHDTIVLVQLFFCLLSAYALFDLAKEISKSRIGGIVAIGFYLTNPFMVTWHLYILTESLYTSFIILSCWTINRMIVYPLKKYYFLAIITASLTLFIRPNGWIIIPIIYSCFILQKRISVLKKTITIAIGIVGFFMCILFIPSLSNSVKVDSPSILLKEGLVVWGHPELQLIMPAKTDHNDSVINYILSNPYDCFKLAIHRVGAMLIQTRPYRSFLYNFRILIWLVPSYSLALLGIFYYGHKSTSLIAIALILGHLFIGALTYASAESRFIIYILPLIYLFSGCGFVVLLNKISSSLNYRTSTAEQSSKHA